MSPFSLITALVCILLCQRGCLSTTTTTSTNTATTVAASNDSTATTGSSTAITGSSSATNGSSTANASSSNTTSSVPETTLPPTTTTLATTTTTKPPFDIKHNTDRAMYVLKLTVGLSNNSNIQYHYANQTREELLGKLRSYFNFSSFVSLDSNNTASQTMEPFILRVEFMIKNPNSSNDLRVQIMTTLTAINSSADFSVPNFNITTDVVDQFIASLMNICSAENVCPLGFTCNTEGCQHICKTQDCNSHGTCYASIDSRATVTTICHCDSEYETEYLGDNCQYSRRGRLQIIAIIAGVLGAACLVFIIIIIVLCVMRSRHKSSSNYNLSGAAYANNAYDNSHQK